jgi:hypothetical protein
MEILAAGRPFGRASHAQKIKRHRRARGVHAGSVDARANAAGGTKDACR